mmetsp:Transcript_22033/g.35831  ORF Transcript_22033/g.35831 Transcript_22033/m.35831 type:complete len:293 (-) Transcript_22033:369-1247(-)
MVSLEGIPPASYSSTNERTLLHKIRPYFIGRLHPIQLINRHAIQLQLLNRRLRLLMIRAQSLLCRFFIIVRPPRRLRPFQYPLHHRLVRHVDLDREFGTAAHLIEIHVILQIARKAIQRHERSRKSPQLFLQQCDNGSARYQPPLVHRSRNGLRQRTAALDLVPQHVPAGKMRHPGLFYQPFAERALSRSGSAHDEGHPKTGSDAPRQIHFGWVGHESNEFVEAYDTIVILIGGIHDIGNVKFGKGAARRGEEAGELVEREVSRSISIEGAECGYQRVNIEWRRVVCVCRCR